MKTETKLSFVCSLEPIAGQVLVKLEKDGQTLQFLEDTREEALDTVFSLLENKS